MQDNTRWTGEYMTDGTAEDMDRLGLVPLFFAVSR